MTNPKTRLLSWLRAALIGLAIQLSLAPISAKAETDRTLLNFQTSVMPDASLGSSFDLGRLPQIRSQDRSYEDKTQPQPPQVPVATGGQGGSTTGLPQGHFAALNDMVGDNGVEQMVLDGSQAGPYAVDFGYITMGPNSATVDLKSVFVDQPDNFHILGGAQVGEAALGFTFVERVTTGSPSDMSVYIQDGSELDAGAWANSFEAMSHE